MLWEYFIDASKNTLKSAKSAFWFGKTIFLLAYFAFCLGVGIYGIKNLPAIFLIAVTAVDFLIFCVMLLLSFKGHDIFKAKQKALANLLGSLQIFRIVFRFLDATLVFVVCAMLVNINATALTIICLMFSCILLLFVYAKELIYTIYKYIKYKATKNFKEFYDVVKRDVIAKNVGVEILESSDDE